MKRFLVFISDGNDDNRVIQSDSIKYQYLYFDTDKESILTSHVMLVIEREGNKIVSMFNPNDEFSD